MSARALASALATLVLAAGAAGAQVADDAGECVEEAQVRDVAAELQAQEIFPLRGNKGTHYIMMVFESGAGVVMAANEAGCYGTAIVMDPSHIEQVRMHSATA